MEPYILNVFLSMTNKMQRCVILFITANALAVTANKFDKYLVLHIHAYLSS
jgi:hypothetical protein